MREDLLGGILSPRYWERSAAVSKTSRSAWEVRRRRELAACCGWSRTTQPRSVPLKSQIANLKSKILSFISQGDHRIDLGGAAGGDIAGQQRDHGQHKRHDDK